MGMVSCCVFYISVLQGIKEITPAGPQIRWALRLQNKLFYKFIEEEEVSQVEVDFNSNNYETDYGKYLFISYVHARFILCCTSLKEKYEPIPTSSEFFLFLS